MFNTCQKHLSNSVTRGQENLFSQGPFLPQKLMLLRTVRSIKKGWSHTKIYFSAVTEVNPDITL